LRRSKLHFTNATTTAKAARVRGRAATVEHQAQVTPLQIEADIKVEVLAIVRVDAAAVDSVVVDVVDVMSEADAEVVVGLVVDSRASQATDHQKAKVRTSRDLTASQPQHPQRAESDPDLCEMKSHCKQIPAGLCNIHGRRHTKDLTRMETVQQELLGRNGDRANDRLSQIRSGFIQSSQVRSGWELELFSFLSAGERIPFRPHVFYNLLPKSQKPEQIQLMVRSSCLLGGM